MKVLSGHVSPETAYVVDDYPYGYKLRCKIRYWVETKKGFGMRFVSQTTNPKRGDMWNKPKPGNYYTFITLYLDEHDHVDWRSVSLGQPGSCMKFYYSDPINPTAEAFALLDEARLVCPDAVLQWCPVFKRYCAESTFPGDGGLINYFGKDVDIEDLVREEAEE